MPRPANEFQWLAKTGTKIKDAVYEVVLEIGKAIETNEEVAKKHWKDHGKGDVKNFDSFCVLMRKLVLINLGTPVSDKTIFSKKFPRTAECTKLEILDLKTMAREVSDETGSRRLGMGALRSRSQQKVIERSVSHNKSRVGIKTTEGQRIDDSYSHQGAQSKRYNTVVETGPASVVGKIDRRSVSQKRGQIRADSRGKTNISQAPLQSLQAHSKAPTQANQAQAPTTQSELRGESSGSSEDFIAKMENLAIEMKSCLDNFIIEASALHQKQNEKVQSIMSNIQTLKDSHSKLATANSKLEGCEENEDVKTTISVLNSIQTTADNLLSSKLWNLNQAKVSSLNQEITNQPEDDESEDYF